MIGFNELCFNAKKGDKESVEEIIKRFNPLLISLANKFPYDDFNDMLQDGRVRIMECIKEFDPKKGKDFLGYLNVQLRFFYRNKARCRINALSLNEKSTDDCDTEIIDLIKNEGLSIEETIINNILKSELKIAFGKLTEKQKKIILLHYFERISMADIAKEMGLHYQSIVKLKNRAIKKLREIIYTKQ
ncbi:MAG: sigma-70 family RNA polymerase sigma factor [Thermoanaerobacteraceae bacterium]|nr:sigma-70 family RNA polymerase sigma factor [Thermoanaerobacteraceae bacterium]